MSLNPKVFEDAAAAIEKNGWYSMGSGRGSDCLGLAINHAAHRLNVPDDPYVRSLLAHVGLSTEGTEEAAWTRIIEYNDSIPKEDGERRAVALLRVLASKVKGEAA